MKLRRGISVRGRPVDSDPIVGTLRADIVTRRPIDNVDIRRMREAI